MLILNDQNFEAEVLKSDLPVLIDFWAEWCGPCRLVEPVIEELAKEFKGKVKVGKLNVDENQKITEKYKVMSIPTIIVFRGGKEIERKIGAQKKEEYERLIKETIKLCMI